MRMSQEEFSSILQRIESDTTFAKANFQFEQMTDDDVSALSDSLKKSKSLTELNLSNNGITDFGASALTEALKVNKSLSKLNLSFNAITDLGAPSLATSLEENSTLNDLNLGANKIGALGLQTLSISLGKNKALTSINLGSNLVKSSEAIAAYIIDNIQDNTTLTKIGTGIGVSPSSIRELNGRNSNLALEISDKFYQKYLNPETTLNFSKPESIFLRNVSRPQNCVAAFNLFYERFNSEGSLNSLRREESQTGLTALFESEMPSPKSLMLEKENLLDLFKILGITKDIKKAITENPEHRLLEIPDRAFNNIVSFLDVHDFLKPLPEIRIKNPEEAVTNLVRTSARSSGVGHI